MAIELECLSRRWVEANAAAMLVALCAVAGGASVKLMLALALLSFSAVTFLCRGYWTPSGDFGAANAVTMSRGLIATSLLWCGALPVAAQVTASALVLTLDGWDGHLARKRGSVSNYGAMLDGEVDAFFTLALCLSLYQSERFGLWILIPGSLRYLFVLAARLVRTPRPEAQPNRWSRLIGAVTLGGLTFALLPTGFWATLIAALVTIAVAASFAHSFWCLLRPCQESG